MESNKLLSYFNSFDRRIALLCKMITIINIHNLSQENVSCLNTTLVLLMLANRRKKLASYLSAIKAKSMQMRQEVNLIHNSSNTSATSAANSDLNGLPSPSVQNDLIENFKDLLVFWQSHYLQKDKDCVGLEQNSRIEFAYWKNTVELLLDPNPKNKCSLDHYLNGEKPLFDKNKTNRIDEYRCD